MVTVTGRVTVGSQVLTPTADVTLPVTQPSTITHGSQVTATNVGLAGKGVTNAMLTVVSGNVNASSLGTTVTRRWFKGNVTINANINFVECRFDQPIVNTGSSRFTITDSNVETLTAGDHALGYHNYDALRCVLTGCSDGVRTNGNVTVTECYIRVRNQGSADHSDGVQNHDGNGPVDIIRCNLDIRGSTGQNAVLFSADGAVGNTRWHDNWCAGGGYSIRPHEACVFDIQGNQVLDGSWSFGPSNKTNMVSSSKWGTVRPNVVVNAAGGVVRTIP